MCTNCLQEHDAWSALPATQKMRDVAAWIDVLYDEHPTGGPIHIVVDDFNIEDDHLKIWGEASDGAVALCTDILEALKEMTLAQRAATIGIAHHMINPDDPGKDGLYG